MGMLERWNDEKISIYGELNDFYYKKLKSNDSDIISFSTTIGDKFKLPNAIQEIEELLNNHFEEGINLKGRIILLDVSHAQQYCSAEDCLRLIELEKRAKAYGADLFLQDGDYFSIEDAVNANIKLNAIVEDINSKRVESENNRPLNELEKFIMAYEYVTNFKYLEHENDASYSRYLTSILNTNFIVCVGYAKLLKELCGRLNIECYINTCAVSDKSGKSLGGHENNCVIIDGIPYYVDACWDSLTGKEQGAHLYNHCLIPLRDRKCFKKVDLDFSYSGAFVSIEEQKLLLKAMKDSKYDPDSEACKGTQLYGITRAYNINLERIKIDDVEIDESQYPSFREMYRARLELRDRKNIEQDVLAVANKIKKVDENESISYEEFECALINIRIAEGMSEKQAKQIVERTMKHNEKEAHKIFNETATNCFYVGRTEILEV